MVSFVSLFICILAWHCEVLLSSNILVQFEVNVNPNKPPVVFQLFEEDRKQVDKVCKAFLTKHNALTANNASILAATVRKKLPPVISSSKLSKEKIRRTPHHGIVHPSPNINNTPRARKNVQKPVFKQAWSLQEHVEALWASGNNSLYSGWIGATVLAYNSETNTYHLLYDDGAADSAVPDEDIRLLRPNYKMPPEPSFKLEVEFGSEHATAPAAILYIYMEEKHLVNRVCDAFLRRHVGNGSGVANDFDFSKILEALVTAVKKRIGNFSHSQEYKNIDTTSDNNKKNSVSDAELAADQWLENILVTANEEHKARLNARKTRSNLQTIKIEDSFSSIANKTESKYISFQWKNGLFLKILLVCVVTVFIAFLIKYVCDQNQRDEVKTVTLNDPQVNEDEVSMPNSPIHSPKEIKRKKKKNRGIKKRNRWVKVNSEAADALKKKQVQESKLLEEKRARAIEMEEKTKSESKMSNNNHQSIEDDIALLQETGAFSVILVTDLVGRLLSERLPTSGKIMVDEKPVRITGLDGEILVGELCALSRMLRSKKTNFKIGQAEFGQITRDKGHTLQAKTKDGKLRLIAVRAPPRLYVCLYVSGNPNLEAMGNSVLEDIRAKK